MDKATAVRDAVARLIADVYSGKLNPRIAAGLAPLMHLRLRAIEKTDLEERVAKMEKLLKAPLDEVKIRIGNCNLLARNPGGESR